jgi:amidase
MAFLEYGSDLVGSVRIPASFCGVYGLKPSAGIVPRTGLQPPGPPPTEAPLTPAVGPLARAAGDLRVALAATAGPEDPTTKAFSWALAPPRHRRLADFRVGVVLDDPRAPVTAEVGAVLSEAVDALSRAGATVVDGWPDGVDPGQSAESFGFQVGLFFAFNQPGAEGFAPLSAVVEQERRRQAARAAWSRYFAEVDVFLCPTNFTAAFPHDPRPFDERTIATPDGERPYADQPFWISHASLAGLPAVAGPVGRTPGGLPVGVQVVGPPFEDDTAITFAELLADVTDGFQPPPSPAT